VGEPLVETTDETGVRTIRLNRPEALNAFNRQLFEELHDVLRGVERDETVRVVLLTGAGRAFCVGQDLREIQSQPGVNETARLGTLLRSRYNALIVRLRAVQKPVMAAVNGVAAGAGMSLALACDLRVASRQASFVSAFSAIALVPDSGMLYFLPRLIGWSKAYELMLTSDEINAEEALKLGLVNKVMEGDDFELAVQEYAARLAQGPSVAYQLIKRGLLRSETSSLESMLELEAQYQEIAGRTEDFREGLDAFVAKRRPHFKGR
jgi:2-(1,2-epoxy-1,2-dihydrophenyl)acetyl-CoA isomerase